MTGETLGYQLTRSYPVSAERLFAALTDATVLKKIWGVQDITVDTRVGGKAVAVFVDGGQDWSFTITYAEVVPNRRLKWVTHFHRFPTKETHVTVLFDDAAPGTELTIRMQNFESADERDANRQAWERGLEALATVVGASTAIDPAEV
jgi:uncharacterized protein YndB with AHSA1/START domain